MPAFKPGPEKTGKENELRIQQLLAFTAGMFQGDVTVHTLLESLAEGVLVIDTSGTILFVNSRVEKMFGYPKQELIGKPHSIIIPECFRKVQEEHEAHYYETPRVGPMGQLLDLAGLRRDGSEIPVDLNLGSIKTMNGVFVLALVTDITPRKQTEQALRQSEELFHIQLECVRDYAIVTLDPHGNLLNWNSGAERLRGFRAEEIIGKHFSCFYSQEERDAGRPEANLEKAAAGGRVEDEGWRLRSDGSRFWAEVIITALRGENGELRGFSHVTHDITARKRTEDALRLSEARYRALFNDNPTVVTTLDTELTVLSVNPACTSILGYQIEELEGQSVLKLFQKKDHQAVAEQLRLCFQHPDQVYRWQFRKIHKNGALLWVEETAQAVHAPDGSLNLLFVCQDITQQKDAEEALRESEERFRLLADTAPVMIWESEADARCTFFNKAWLDFTGRPLEQELGRGWTQGVHPDDIEYCLGTYLSAAKSRKNYCMEYRLQRADGSYGWVVENGAPRLAQNGKLLGYIGTCFDITERRQAKEELQQANELLVQRVAERTAELSDIIESLKIEINERIRMGQALREETAERLNAQAELREKELLLLQQSRLAAMGEMIGNIAHQWRQPLNVLGLLAQDLAMTYKLGEFSTQYLETNVRKVLETINHLSKTIDDFRNFFSTDKDKVDFSIVESIEKTISLLQANLSADKISTVFAPASDPVVNGYPSEFSQVLLNIMVNAKDALVTKQVANPTITIETGRQDGRSVVTITDNAGGIPEEIIDKIFDPYFTTKGPDKGTGVGLYMSKIIIEKNMGGSLTVCNQGDGAQFRIVV